MKNFSDINIQCIIFLPSFSPDIFAGLETENYTNFFSTKDFSSKIGEKTSLSWLQSWCGHTTSSIAAFGTPSFTRTFSCEPWPASVQGSMAQALIKALWKSYAKSKNPVLQLYVHVIPLLLAKTVSLVLPCSPPKQSYLYPTMRNGKSQN